MSRSNIDERIVQMEFQNGQFEKGVHTSIESLNALKKSLDFDGAEKGLENLERSTRHFSMNGLTGAIEAVSGKFSAMEIVAITALQRITNKAMDAGERMIKSLSIDQISAGFSKYTDKTKSVNTILNATGEDLDYVNERLDKLNWFTDETSYNFTDMVSNIGKFTSAGVDLDSATTAMMGIATEAALSGQGINEASRAMYNFAQAIGTGQVKLMDWRSIENANMGTQEFKQTIIDTAVAMGTLKKSSDGTTKTTKGTTVSFKNFNETLSENWFTSEVLIETLRKYGEYAEEVYKVASEDGITAAQAMEKLGDAGMELGAKAFKAAQVARTFTDAIEATKDAVSSGWMQSFELIFGNVDESAELWTDVTNALWEVFASGAEKRNEVLAAWKEAGGRADLLQGLYDSFESLWSIITTVKDALATIFPVDWTQKAQEFSNGIKDFGANLKKTFGIEQKLVGSEERDIIEKIPNFSEEFDGVLERGATGLGVKAMQESLEKLGFDLGTAGADGIFGPKTEEALKQFQEKSNQTIDGIYSEATHKSVMGALYGTHDKVVGTETVDVYEEELSPALEKIKTITEGFGSVAKIAGEALRFLGDSFSYSLEIISPITSTFADFGVTISRCFTSLSESIDENDTFGTWLADLKTNLEPVKNWISEFASNLREFLGVDKDISTFDELFEHFQEQFDKFLSNHPEISKAWGVIQPILQSIGKVLSSLSGYISDFFSVNNEKKGNGFGDFLSSIFDNALDLASKLNWPGILIAVLTIQKIVAVIKAIKFPATVVKSITSIPGKIGETLDSLKGAFDRFGSEKDTIGGTALKIAISLALLAGSINAISKIPVDKAWNAVAVLTVMSGVLVGVAFVMNKVGKINRSSTTGLVFMAIAIRIMVSALVALQDLSFGDVLTGVIGIAAVLAVMIGYQKLMQGVKPSSSLAIVGVAISLILLMNPLKQLAEMNLGDIVKGSFGILAVLTMIAGYQKLMQGVKPSSSLALAGVAISLILLMNPLKQLAEMNLGDIVKGSFGILAVLTMIAGYQKLMQGVKPSSSLALAGVALGLILLMNPLKQLAEMNLGEIAKGSFGILAVLTMIAGYQKLMQGVKPSSSLALVGVAISLILLMNPLKQLAEMSLGEMISGLVGLAGIIGSVVILSKSIGHVSISKIVSLVAMSFAIRMIVQAFTPLTEYSLSQIANGLIGFSGIILATAAFVKFVGGANLDLKGIASLLLLSLSIKIIASAFKDIANVDASRMVAFAGSLSMMLISLSASLAIVNNFGGGVGGMAKGAAGIGAALAIIVAIATAVVSILGLIDESTNGGLVDDITRGGAVLSALANALNPFGSALTSGLAAAGLVAASALAGYIGPSMIGGAAIVGASLGVLVAIATAVVASLGSLNNIPGAEGRLTEVINGGGDVLRSLGTALASFGSGFLEVVSGDLTKFATSIKEVRSAIDGLGFDADSKNGGTLAEDIDEAIKLVSFLHDYFGTIEPYETNATNSNLGTYTSAANQLSLDISSFSTAISNVRTSMTGLSDGLLTEADIKMATDIAQNIHDFFSGLIPYNVQVLPDGGYFTAPSQLSSDMTSFSEAMEAFKTGIGGITKDYSSLEADTASALSAAEQVYIFFSGLTTDYETLTSGDLDYDMFRRKVVELTDNELTSLSTSLSGFKTRLLGISESTLEVDTEKALSVVGKVATFMADANELAIPTNQNAFQKIFGTKNKVESLFEDMGRLGDEMQAIKGKISLLGAEDSTFETDFGVALRSLQAMATFLSQIPDMNIEEGKSPLEKFFTGGTKTDTVFDGLSELGTKMKEVGGKISDLGSGTFESDFAAAIRALNAMATFLNRVGQLTNEGHLNGADFELVLFPMQNLMDTIGELQTNTDGVDLTSFSLIVEVVASGLTKIAESGATMAQYASGSTISTILTDMIAQFEEAGSSLTEGFVDGIDESEVTSAVTDLMAAAMEVAEQKVSHFQEIGKLCSQGLAIGIRAGSGAVAVAVERVMTEAIQKAREVADQNSPSRVFFGIGMNNDLGLANGFLKYGKVVDAAAEDVSEGAVQTTRSILGKLSAMITDDMDTTPTIRPVMDLSDISSGVATMHNMIDSQSIGYTTGKIARSIASESNGSVTPVYSNKFEYNDMLSRLHSEFTELTDAVSRMQMVTDTGALVGAIGPTVDRYLGNQIRIESRR